jgi:RND family efflux transporter MFP subunit
VQELKKGSISKLINTTGTAQSTYGAELNSETSGMYKLQNNPRTGKPFKLGDAVKKGQLIIRLENKEYENGIALESKKLSLEIAEQEQSKQKALYEKGGVTLSEMRNTEVRVTNARYDLENATINLEKMNIKAPFDGVIVSLPHYTIDSRVEQGSPMVGTMDYTRMYMDINLPESTIEYIKATQPVHITHYTLPNDTLYGVISELSPAISIETRTFKGKILIDNTALKLRPGMFVKADVVVDKADSVIIIPKDIILSARNRKFVYIVEKNTAIVRNIQTGLEDEDNIQVTEGLNENDNLIIRGYETLRENSRVKVLK